MKYFCSLICCLLLLPVQALVLIDADTQIELDLKELLKQADTEITVQKEKNGITYEETWRGLPLQSLLQQNIIENYDRIRIEAADNYQVRINRSEITSEDPILAFYRNNEELAPDRIRIVSELLPAMHWIRDIQAIRVEKADEIAIPRRLYPAAAILAAKPLRLDPGPFADAVGYYLNDLITGIFPYPQGEFYLVGRDGVRHLLDYQNYLKEAVLIRESDGFTLKSPQMPAGMWIKQLCYLQQEDTSILFTDLFQEWQEISSLLNWPAAMNQGYLHAQDLSGAVDLNESYKDISWLKVDKITW